jgi:hypothetical protein
MRKLLESIWFLEKENAELKKFVALLRKHSGNSSKSPSSDRVKPPKDNLGKRFWERFWSISKTCVQQGKNIMQLLKNCIKINIVHYEK